MADGPLCRLCKASRPVDGSDYVWGDRWRDSRLAGPTPKPKSAAEGNRPLGSPPAEIGREFVGVSHAPTISTSGDQRSGIPVATSQAVTGSWRNPSVLRDEMERNVRAAKAAIDDFGTGSSSYAYLQNFPFDVVKIDKSFIQHNEGTADTRELTRKIIEVGKVLKLEIVAEGSEEENQLEELRAMGCEVGQGYLFAKPMDAADVPGHLAEEFARKAA